ncbi:hypothetical protein ACFQ0D_24105 [Micromonospora zhanjiangensis]
MTATKTANAADRSTSRTVPTRPVWHAARFGTTAPTDSIRLSATTAAPATRSARQHTAATTVDAPARSTPTISLVRRPSQ